MVQFLVVRMLVPFDQQHANLSGEVACFHGSAVRRNSFDKVPAIQDSFETPVRMLISRLTHADARSVCDN